MTTQPFDLASLRKPITFSEARRQYASYGMAWKIGFVTLAIVAAVPLLLLIGLSAGGVISAGGAFFLAVVAAGGLYGMYDLYRELNENTLVQRLAVANGMEYRRDYHAEGYPGFMFETYNHIPRSLRTRGALFVELGQQRPFLNRRSQASTTYSYIRIKLPRALPRIILKRRSGSLLALQPDGSAQLRLEGKFGDLFALFAPTGYEQDALYIFTPDVMERFMDATPEFDCEIIGDELYFYSAKKFDLADPATLTKAATIINHVLEKFARQSGKYHDDRVSLLQVSGPASFQLKLPVFNKVILAVFGLALVVVVVLQISR